MNVITIYVNYITLLEIKKLNFVISKTLNIMENKYIKNMQSSIENVHLHFVDSSQQKVIFIGKWLSYVLMTTALILWITFNIVAIESYQFPPYLLVVMNLILYCVIAAMINPDNYSDTKR